MPPTDAEGRGAGRRERGGGRGADPGGPYSSQPSPRGGGGGGGGDPGGETRGGGMLRGAAAGFGRSWRGAKGRWVGPSCHAAFNVMRTRPSGVSASRSCAIGGRSR